MPEPKTIRHWTERGYSFVRRGECPACSNPVEFWKRGTMEIMLDPQTYEAHFSQCSRAQEYRIELQMKEGIL